MRIFKILFVAGVMCMFSHSSFASKRVMGDFTVSTKAESDVLKVDLAALSKITESEKLEVVQYTDNRDDKVAPKEAISLDIVFKDGQEAQDYFTQLTKQPQNAKVTIHECKNSEYTGLPNVSCVLDDEVILTKQ